MFKRLLPLWQRLTGSLWFVPALMVTGAALLAVGLIDAQRFVDREALEKYPRIFGASAESSRSMLSAIAGSMITIAGVTFSITVVAVSQASNQYTPRILRNFMRDRPSQIVLGVFVGVFVYCLIVVRTIRGDDELRFIPSLAVLGAFFLAVVGIGFLVYFIHHIATTLEAGSILARVGRETVEAVDRLFPDEVGEEPDDRAPGMQPSVWFTIPARTTGYIQNLDADGLLEFAASNGTVVRMERGIGDFVVAGLPIVSIGSRQANEELTKRLNDLYTVDAYRTVYQDAEFGIRQLVDIALKALSPGINDTTTAITSLDHIGAVLIRMATRSIGQRFRLDDEGELRVIARGPTFVSLLKTALDEIRQNAAGNVSVLARMLTTLERVASCTADEGRRALLREHAALIERTAAQTIPAPEDVRDVRERYDALLATLAVPAGAYDI